MKKNKRLVVLSDFHCGHRIGLTPTSYISTDKNKYRKLQIECWEWYKSEINKLKPIDFLVLNGDAIDGRGEISGGTEQTHVDRYQQVQMAIECLDHVEAKKIVMTYGSAYHTGKFEDWEDVIAKNVKAKIGSHEWIDINGLVFDFKHHLGSSGIPHGRHTAIAKEKMWNVLWSEHQDQPKGDIIIRSHVHYFNYSGGPDWLGITTPALQAMGSKYGARRCTGLVDFGFLHFDIDTNGGYNWQAHLIRLQGQKARALKL